MKTLRTMLRTARGRVGSVNKSVKEKVNLSRRSKCCYLCQKTFASFRPFRDGWNSLSPFIRELEVVGSDVENFACPNCGCHDRTRHLVMYFDALNLWDRFREAAVLHIAPESHLAERIYQHAPKLYVRGDLAPDPGTEMLDVTAIPYPAYHFDFVVCNHVLEHVLDDRRACSELFRVTKQGGCAVLQTPYSPVLQNSFVDPAIDTDALRNRYYAQEDNVRLYGRDLFARITEAGFRLDLKTHRECLSGFDSSYYGVNPAEELIFAVKE